MEDEVKKLEGILGFKIPNDYKKFLIENNQRIFKLLKYRAGGTRLTSYVKNFFYLRGDEDINLFNVFQQHKHELVKGLFPIANDPRDDLIVMSLNKKDYGSIYHWDYKCEPEIIRRPSYKYMIKISDSFTKFYESLVPYEEEK